VNNNSYTHFVVCYGYSSKTKCFVIGDPAEGVMEYTEEALSAIWKTGLLLTLKPHSNFQIDKHLLKRGKFLFLTNLISPDKHILFITFILSLTTSSLSFATAIFSQKLIDDILPSRNINVLFSFIALYSIVICIGYLLSFLKNLFIIRQTQLFNVRLISTFLGKIFSFPISFFNSMRTGEIVARMKETERIQGFIIALIDSTLVELLTLILSILFLMYYNIKIACIAALSIPLLIIISKYFAKLIKRRQKELLVYYADFEAYSVESISGIKFVKNFVQEFFFKDRLISKYATTQETTKLLGKITFGYDLIVGLLGSFFSVIAISLGAYYVMVDKLQIGELFAIITILSLTISTTVSIISIVVQIQESFVSLDRLQDIVDASEEEISVAENEVKYLLNGKIEVHSLKLQNISFNYPGKLMLLNNISITVTTGEMITLFGDIGEGKSTLLNLIQRFYFPRNGIISYDGININDYSISDWRLNLSVVSQFTKIFMGTVADNITLFKTYTLDDIKEFCRDLGLFCFIEEGPLNLMNPLNEDGVNLSGGQAQLIGFARVLYSRSKILILDEPTSAMDKSNELIMMKILNRIKNEKITIMITHKPEIAKKTDKIYVLQNGSIQAEGSHSELIKYNNSYSSSYRYLFE
jgi:ATP-binding cassette subfamily B protein